MSRVRCVIVDDEPAAREVLRTMLAEHAAVEIAGEASNGIEAERVIRDVKPDLVFLDVQMPDRDGFGVLESLGPDVPRGVVFVTAHDEHAIRAFEVQAFDYLLKPFGRARFTAALTRALERLRAPETLTLQRIAVRTGSRMTLVDVAEIDWVEADGDYARIHAGKQAHLVSQRLHALAQMLEKAGFVRIHRSLIVNAHRMKELNRQPDGSGFITLASGVKLRVARNRWDDLLAVVDRDR